MRNAWWVLLVLLGCAAVEANRRYDWVQRCQHMWGMTEPQCDKAYDDPDSWLIQKQVEACVARLGISVERCNSMRLYQGRECCVNCSKGQPCGNSCISWSYTCHQPPGCAC